MRVVFMGTPAFSVPVLTALVEAGHTVAAVVTQPDKPRGRGKAPQASPVKEKALEYGIPVLQPVKVREPEFVEELKKLAPEVMVVVAFGQILTREVLAVPAYGCINVHASLLPMYRGAAPIQQVILDGRQETGVTTMFMDEGLDTGDMLLRTVVPIAPEETGGSLTEKLSAAGAPLLIETLRRLEEGTLERTPQTGETCYAGMLKKSMGRIDWSRSAAELERLVRGMDPWPSAYTTRNGKGLKIWSARVETAEAGTHAGEHTRYAPESGAAPGTVVRTGRDGIWVQAGDGLLVIRELQPEGKKRMAADAYLRGYPVQPGERLE